MVKEKLTGRLYAIAGFLILFLSLMSASIVLAESQLITVARYEADSQQSLVETYREAYSNTKLVSDANHPIAKRVFVTSKLYDGDLGGLSGADDKCQSHAEDAGLSGKYKAWLSDKSTPVSERVNQSRASYFKTMVDGRKITIADSWHDLAKGQLLEPIDTDESGSRAFVISPGHGEYVWTGPHYEGHSDMEASKLAYNDCNFWSNNNRRTNGQWQTGSTCIYSPEGDAWQETHTSGFCDLAFRLYCVEQ